jgi:hypothetical protein
VGSFRRTASAGAEVVAPTEAAFGSVRLAAASFPRSVRAGEIVPVELLWVALRDAPTGDAAVVLKSTVDGSERTLAGGTLENLDPTTPWLVGEPQRDVRTFAPTRAEVGAWSLIARAGRSELVVGRVDVAAPPAQSAAVHAQRPAEGQFEGLARLVGYDVLDGRVRLYWQALGSAQENYTVFVHALDAGDRILAQNDAAPAGGARPTRGWAAGETIVDEHPLTVPSGTRALAVGLYDARTGQRVPLRGGGDRLVLPLDAPSP